MSSKATFYVSYNQELNQYCIWKQFAINGYTHHFPMIKTKSKAKAERIIKEFIARTETQNESV